MAYCTRSDIEELYGEANVEQWADLNNTRVPSEITARINQAITDAEGLIEAKFINSPYSLPLTDPVLPKRWNATLAAVLLSRGRALQSGGGAQMSAAENQVNAQIADALSGKLVLDSTRSIVGPQPMTAVPYE